MDDAVIHAEQLPDCAAISECYRSICDGKYLSDDIVSGIIVYLRHQLRSCTDSPDDVLRVKDNILLCLSTLLSACLLYTSDAADE